MENEIRPWGEYFVLEEAKNYKVKKIIVNPGKRLSYQYHHNRSEVWIITQGQALITINDVDKVFEVGEVAIIPKMARHRVKNQLEKDLIFIEVQLGNYFGEDDIVRIEDDYNRQ